MRVTLFSLFIFVLFNAACKMNRKGSKIFIYDKASIFDQSQFNYLDSTVRDYEDETTSEIYVYTVDSIPNTTATGESYAVNLLNELGVGKPGLNNGLILLLSMNKKRIDLQLSHGFEWVINSNDRDSIIKDIISSCSSGKCFDGIKGAIHRIIMISKSTSWSICNSEENSNCIKQIKAMGVMPIDDTTFKVNTLTGKDLAISYTKYMKNLFEEIKTIKNITIVYRSVGVNPKKNYLLGTIRK